LDSQKRGYSLRIAAFIFIRNPNTAPRTMRRYFWFMQLHR